MVSETKTTEAPGLRRELKARHLTMIAIGGSIAIMIGNFFLSPVMAVGFLFVPF